MNTVNDKLVNILSSEVFRTALTGNLLQIEKLNVLLLLLIQARIPFDLTYSPGTRRLAAAANLTIYINPTTSLSFTISLEPGGSIFG
jgi:hypothetical protein